MKYRMFVLSCALAACAFPCAAQESTAAKPAQEKAVTLPEAERKAASKINEAKDPAAKLSAAVDFIKKYPKSAARTMLAEHLVGEIGAVKDASQRLKLTENYLTVFNEPAEAGLVTPLLLDGYLSANRLDDAFRVAGPWLEKNPNDVESLRRLSMMGANEAYRQNNKYAQQSQQYGIKAVELLETDVKPATFDDAQWQQYKTRWLPLLYREMGMLALVMNNNKDAQVRLENAAALKSTDPTVYAILGNIANDEYLELAKSYNAMPAGAAKDEALKKAQDSMDKVLELYAQAIAISGNKPEYQQVRDQVMPALQDYYKNRHQGSTDGLQKLIDKYKQPASK